MSKLKAIKVNTIPGAGSREADTIYLAKAADPEYLDISVTNQDASEIRRVVSKSDVSTLINNAISNALFKETGVATPRTLQGVINANTLYRTRKQAVEMFASGYNIQVTSDIAVLTGTSGNNWIDIADTSTIVVNQDYLLTNGTLTVIIRPTIILSSVRLQLSANLVNNWGGTAVLTGSTLDVNANGGADAATGDQWISKKINLGDDSAKRVVTIRRTANTGVVHLYYRDSFTTSWTEATRSLRSAGNAVNGIPTGFYDDKYLVPLKGDGYLRIATDTAAVTIKHIVGLFYETVSVGDFLGDDGALAAFQAAVDCTPDAGTQIIEVPAGTYAGSLNTLTLGSRKIVWREAYGVTYSGTAPLGLRSLAINFNVPSVKELVGVAGTISGQQVNVASYHTYNATLVRPKGGGYFIWDATKAKTAHDGITIFSPSVPWDGTMATIGDFHAKVGETNLGGTTGCWIRQFQTLDLYMAGCQGLSTTVDDSVPFQSIMNYMTANSRSILVPAASFRVENITITGRWSLFGEGTYSILKCNTTTVPMLTLNATGSIYYAYMADMFFQGPVSSDPASCAIRLTGIDTTFVSYCKFSRITCQGFNAFFKNEKPMVNSAWGMSNNMHWCIWSEINLIQIGQYCWWYTTGSGTGNVWSTITASTLNSPSAIWFFDGNAAVVGDVLINNAHLGCANASGSSGVKIGDNTVYRARFSLINCQFDAYCQRPLELSSVGSTAYVEWHLEGCNHGGDVHIGDFIPYMSMTTINDMEIDLRRVGKRKDSTTPGAQTVDCFAVELDTSGSAIVEVMANSQITGAGTCVSKYEFLVTCSAGVTTVLELENYQSNSAQLAWSYTTPAANKVVFTFAANPTSSFSTYTQIHTIGFRYKVTRL